LRALAVLAAAAATMVTAKTYFEETFNDGAWANLRRGVGCLFLRGERRAEGVAGVAGRCGGKGAWGCVSGEGGVAWRGGGETRGCGERAAREGGAEGVRSGVGGRRRARAEGVAGAGRGEGGGGRREGSDSKGRRRASGGECGVRVCSWLGVAVGGRRQVLGQDGAWGAGRRG
jgi:hypothetical protein